MRSMLQHILLLGTFLISLSGKADSVTDCTDSLRAQLKKTVDRVERFNLQYDIAGCYYYASKYDTAIIEYHNALAIAPRGDYNLKGAALNMIAWGYTQLEDLDNSIKYFKLAYNAREKAGNDPEILARTLMDLGRSYYGFSKYDSAMVYYLQAKDLYEENEIYNHDHGILHHYIGSVFKRQDDMEKACDYYHKEIEYGRKYNLLSVEADGQYLSSDCLENDTARIYNDIKAMHMFEEAGDLRMASFMYGNIALDYEAIGRLDSALYWHRISLYEKRKSGGKSHLSQELSDIGHLLIRMNRYQEAVPYFEEAEALAKSSDLKKYIRLESIYHGYHLVNYRLKKFRPAIEYLKLYYAYKDSSRDLDHQQMIEELELAHQTEKKEAEIALLKKEKGMNEKERLLAEEEASFQRKSRNYFMFGGIVLLLLGIYIFLKLRESQRQKVIISVQKKEVEIQKALVDEKNKDITDSITYASTIQQAIITSQEELKHMFDDSFVLYKPRDIVSGDFYWAHRNGSETRMFAVGDCTGHGVPGAMMSMLGTTFLNEVVVQGGENQPHEILNKLRVAVKSAMSRSEGRDGMDMSLCKIENGTLSFAGANLPVYIIRNKELIELKGNKQPIGHQPTGEKSFDIQSMPVEKGDLIYLFSDGYADQFGGEKGKKLKYRFFKEKLLEICDKPLSEQLSIIDNAFEDWKGELEQVDDVCVVGVRV